MRGVLSQDRGVCLRNREVMATVGKIKKPDGLSVLSSYPLDRHSETWVTPLGAGPPKGREARIGSSLSSLLWALRDYPHDEILPRPRPEVPRPHCQTGPGDRRRCTHRSLPRVPNRDLRTQTLAHLVKGKIYQSRQ